jgi:molybdopterin-guanine dinucleotide biosynthesis protein A
VARESVAGLVLAGGGSRRMGGRDKAFLVVAGQPLVARAVARLAPQVAAVAISSNRPKDAFAFLGLPVLADDGERRIGPLAGLFAGLAWARDLGFAHVQTVAVDTPGFPADLVARMAAAAGAAGLAVARSGGRVHPVFALVPVRLAADLEAHLRSGGSLRVADWLDRHDPVLVDFDTTRDRDPFFNINTPADLAAQSGAGPASGEG